jgi:hypothetical protein
MAAPHRLRRGGALLCRRGRRVPAATAIPRSKPWHVGFACDGSIKYCVPGTSSPVFVTVHRIGGQFELVAGTGDAN